MAVGVALFSWVGPPLDAYGAMVTVDGLDTVMDANNLSSIAAIVNDPGSDGKISLAEAIAAANNDTADPFDTILFGVSSINITGDLPVIVSRMVIDGSTMNPILNGSGYSGTAVFELTNGSNSSEIKSLRIENSLTTAILARGDTVSCIFRDLVIVGNAQGIEFNGALGSGAHTIAGCKIGTDGTLDLGNDGAGIFMSDSTGNTIGGLNPEDRNIISGNGTVGIFIRSPSVGATGNKIFNNIIGMSEDGLTRIGNADYGVELSPGGTGTIYSTLIGTPDGVDGGNLISGNGLANIFLTGSTVSATAIRANKIGTDINGDVAVPAGGGSIGILISSLILQTQIGGESEADGNLISGNDQQGISISDSRNVTILGNLIGVNHSGDSPLPNGSHGIQISAFGADSRFNRIGGSLEGKNVIAFNNGYAVQLQGSSAIVDKSTITYNAIYSNTSGGISFAMGTENAGLTPPIIASLNDTTPPYSVMGSGTTAGDTLHFYADAGDQGRYFAGEFVATGTTFDAPIDLVPWDGMNISVTRTDGVENTSRFGLSPQPVGNIPPTLTLDVHSGQPDPTGDLPVLFDITADEPLMDFDGDDVVCDGTAGGVTFQVFDQGDGMHFSVEASATSDGTIQPRVPAFGLFTDLSGNQSAVDSMNDVSDGVVTYDATAPSTTVDTLLTNVTSPALTGTIDDPTATISVVVDAGSPVSATNNGDGTWTLAAGLLSPLADGLYEVEATASDGIHEQQDSTSFELTIDTLAPTAGFDALTTNDSSPALSGVNSDSTATILVSVDTQTGLSAANNGAMWNLADNVLSPLADGVYDVILNLVDPVGNPNMVTFSNSLTIDTVPPTVSIETLTTSDPSPALTGTVDDGSPASTSMVVVSVNIGGSSYTALNNSDGTWTLPQGTISPPLAEEAFDAVVSATDAAGNTGFDATNLEIIIDATLPDVTVETLITNNPTPVLTGSVTDGTVASVSVTVGGNSYTAVVDNGVWSATVTNSLADETYDVVATATDGAGQMASDTTTDELIIDTVAPLVTVAPLTTPNTLPTLMGTVEDDYLSGVSVEVDGATYIASVNADIWSADVTTPLMLDTTYDVTVTAVDTAGNEGVDDTLDELLIDTSAPEVTVDRIVTSSIPPVISGTVTGTDIVSVDVSVSSFTYTAVVDGAIWLATATDIVAEGSYFVSTTATDTAGNTGNGSNELIVDQTPPVVTVDPLMTSSSFPVLTGSVTDLTAVTVNVSVGSNTYPAIVDGGTWTATVTTPLANGSYEVIATATDEALNAGIDGTTIELTVNFSIPLVTLNTLFTSNPTPTLTGMAMGSLPIASVDVTVAGTTYSATLDGETWSAPITAALAEGTYSVTVTATDTGDSSGLQTFPNALVIDTTPPAIIVNSLTTNNPLPVISGAATDASNLVVDVTVAGQSYVAFLEGSSWSVQVTDTLADGTYEVEAIATDAAGNETVDPSVNELTVDTVTPAVASITLNSSSPTNLPSVGFTLTFNEPVTGLSGEDFLLVVDGEIQSPDLTEKDLGGTPLHLSISGSGDTYAVTVGTGTGDGTLGLKLSGGSSLIDTAGNTYDGGDVISEAYSIDRTPPTIEISSSEPDPTSTITIPMIVSFSEMIGDFTPAQVVLTNAVVDTTSFQGDGVVYTATIMPLAEGPVTVEVGPGAVRDLAGNDNMAGASFSITYQEVAEGEGEGEGDPGPCLERCDDSSPDGDGDGLSACVEACIGTSDENIDTDGDGMPDGFEFDFGLNPLADDSNLDKDLDDLSNLEEFLESSDPTDPDSPNGPTYVAMDGSDSAGLGSSMNPWRTIGFALTQVTPDAAARPRIIVREGVYEENVALRNDTIVVGEVGAMVVIMGQVTGAEHAALRRVTITPAGDETYLFDMNDVAMELMDVILEGTPERDRTGILVDGARPAGSVIDRCSFTSLAVGIDIADAIPTIRRCTFGDIPADFGDPPTPGAGIIIRDNTAKHLDIAWKSIGDDTSPEAGWNDFLPTVEGFAVINERGEAIPMQNNYWGVVDAEQVMMRVDGPAVQEPFLVRSSAILASSVFCTVWDRQDQKRLGNGNVNLQISTYRPVTDNTDGLYVFPAIAGGPYSLIINAPGYIEQTIDLTVTGGELKSVTVAMEVEQPGGEGEGEGDGGGCAQCSGGEKSLDEILGDLFLTGLTLLSLAIASRRFSPRTGAS